MDGGPSLYILYLVPASYCHCQSTAQNGPLPYLLSNFNGRIGSASAVIKTNEGQTLQKKSKVTLCILRFSILDRLPVPHLHIKVNKMKNKKMKFGWVW